MRLHFDASLCVRAKSRFSNCTKCADVCPSQIQIVNNLPSFIPSTGIQAAACIGVCPTEAFSLSGFSVTEFFFDFLASKVRLISPHVNIPCLSVLSVEHLIALALASDEPISLDLTGYKKGSTLLEYIEATIEEANFVLSSFCDKRLETNTLKSPVQEKSPLAQEETSRRDFLRNVSLQGAIKQKLAFDEAVDAQMLQHFEIDSGMVAKIKNKQLPDKRKILFAVLKKTAAPKVFEILPQDEVSFVSQKYINEDCTNCQICYRVCPTGALSSDNKFSLIHFDAMLCVKCRLCHDVCEPHAIGLQSGFEIKEFFEPTQRTLAVFDVKRCDECGNYFTYTSGEQICPRCKIEEEEALVLHQNAKEFKKEG